MAGKRASKPATGPGRKASASAKPSMNKGGRPRGPTDLTRRYATWRARNERAKAELAALRLARLRGELVPVQKMVADRLDLIRFMASMMDRAAAEISSTCAGLPVEEQRAKIRDYFHRVRTEICKR